MTLSPDANIRNIAGECKSIVKDIDKQKGFLQPQEKRCIRDGTGRCGGHATYCLCSFSPVFRSNLLFESFLKSEDSLLF